MKINGRELNLERGKDKPKWVYFKSKPMSINEFKKAYSQEPKPEVIKRWWEPK